jgi:formylglycine-generating enzyme required for sulfatase activity
MADNSDNFVPDFEDDNRSGPPTPPVLPDRSDVSAHASGSVKASPVPDFSDESPENVPVERFEQLVISDDLFIPAFEDEDLSTPTPKLVSISDLLDGNDELSLEMDEPPEAPEISSPPAPLVSVSDKKPSKLPETPDDGSEVTVRVFFAPGSKESGPSIEKPKMPVAAPPEEPAPPPRPPETSRSQPTGLPVQPGPIEDANDTRPEWEPFGIDLPVEQPESLIPGPDWEEKSSPPTGDYPELRRDIQRETVRQRLKLSPAFVFIISALATLVLLGGGLLAFGYFTDNLPPQAEELIESGIALFGGKPGGTGQQASDTTPTPPTGIIIEPSPEPDETPSAQVTMLPTLTITPTTTPAPVPSDTVGPSVAIPVLPGPTLTPSIVLLEDNQIEQNGAVMVYVPEGSFQMGSGSTEHTVSLDAYYIDQTEVTNGQWRECVAAGICEPPASTADYAGDPYYGVDELDDYPVIYIDWNQANTYCTWRGARLPTEAEWEKAARWDGDTASAQSYPWGNDWDPTLLNFCDQNCPLSGAVLSADDGWAQTAPVGSFPDGASPVGALEMAGNVAEWVYDWFDNSYYSVSPESNPTGPEEGTQRVVRGGAWGVSSSQLLLSSIRSRFEPGEAGPGTGFRCATSAEAVEQ